MRDESRSTERQLTASFVASTFGLGAFAIAILVAAFFTGAVEYSLPAVLVAAAGLLFATRAVIDWAQSKWVRQKAPLSASSVQEFGPFVPDLGAEIGFEWEPSR